MYLDSQHCQKFSRFFVFFSIICVCFFCGHLPVSVMFLFKYLYLIVFSMILIVKSSLLSERRMMKSSSWPWRERRQILIIPNSLVSCSVAKLNYFPGAEFGSGSWKQKYEVFFEIFLSQGLGGSILCLRFFYFMYNIGRLPGFEPEMRRPQPGVLPIVLHTSHIWILMLCQPRNSYYSSSFK